jgi:general secretion pathway protein H
MSIDEPTSQSFEAGFSLVEMLVVLTILALATTFAMPLFSGGSEGLRLQTASSELAAAFRATRSAAIIRNAETTMIIDVDHRTFSSTVVSQRPFAPDIEAKLRFASGIRSASSDGGFLFFPDGSSTGGDVTLSLHGKQTKLCVDWLTGEVRREVAC